MKKLLSLFLCFALVLSFAACSDDSSSNDMVEAYKQAAQKFIDAGDTQSAIKALEEGISATQDDSLKAMLDSISPKEETPATTEEPKAEDKPQEQAAASSTQTAPQAEAPTASSQAPVTPAQPAKPDYSKYAGEWLCDSASLDITSANPDTLDFSLFTTVGNMHVINIELSILVSTIANNTATVAYKDSWNNSGTAVITFKDNSIVFETKNASGGAQDMSFTFTKSGSGATAASGNLLDSMDSAQLTKLNTFLSNFSETYFNEYPTSNECLLDFAFTHNLINGKNTVIYAGNDMGISAAVADNTLDIFFGKTVPHANTGRWAYKNDGFYIEAAGGESYSYFSIAKEMKNNGDNTYTVSFDVFYDQDNFGSFLSEWYSLSHSQAIVRYSFHQTGTAVVREKNRNGKTLYELVSYTVK